MNEKKSSLKNKESVNFIDFTKVQNCQDSKKARLINQIIEADEKLQTNLTRISKEFSIPLHKTKKINR